MAIAPMLLIIISSFWTELVRLFSKNSCFSTWHTHIDNFSELFLENAFDLINNKIRFFHFFILNTSL